MAKFGAAPSVCSVVLALLSIGACATADRGNGFQDVGPNAGQGKTGEAGSIQGSEGETIPSEVFGGSSSKGSEGAGERRDPVTCEEAAASRSNVGCDFWPTVVANNVWSIFDFAVVIANIGTTKALISVSGPNQFTYAAEVPPGTLEKIYLPWVPSLKGPESDACGQAKPLEASVFAKGGAYHLTSSVPVIAYQFNALEYKGEGGPSGKSWADCPGLQECTQNPLLPPQQVGCFAFSNDASLLFPSTAMTGTYRITGQTGWSEKGPLGGGTQDVMPGYFAVTATRDNTQVTVTLSKTATVMASAGGEVTSRTGSGVLSLRMDAGDVAEIVSRKGASSDLSGTLVSASNPVQVISGVPCINQPFGSPACDHIEETVSPAETLGQSYLVAPPTGPKGKAVGHIVRIFGNQDGTNLVFEPSKPPGCPDTIDAGQVVECGKVETAFRVRGDKNFAVASILLGGSIVSPGDPIFGLGGGLGDPSLSLAVPVEQYRKKYLFLAPNDYDLSFADVIAPIGAVIRVDDMPVSVKDLPIGSTGFGTLRVKLGAGKQGAHTLESDRPVGLQVLGYGQYTSYYYPGGLNLGVIAPPPPR